jgi:hypothetical protein
MKFTKFQTTGNVTHLRVPGIQITATGSKAPKTACGARISVTVYPMPDDAEVTCQKCHAGLVK